jgi:hypothetical protein
MFVFVIGPDAAPIAEDVDYPEASGPESGPEFNRLEVNSVDVETPEVGSLEVITQKLSSSDANKSRGGKEKSERLEASSEKLSNSNTGKSEGGNEKSRRLEASSEKLRNSNTGKSGGGKEKSERLEATKNAPAKSQQLSKPNKPSASNYYLPPVQVRQFKKRISWKMWKLSLHITQIN